MIKPSYCLLEVCSRSALFKKKICPGLAIQEKKKKVQSTIQILNGLFKFSPATFIVKSQKQKCEPPVSPLWQSVYGIIRELKCPPIRRWELETVFTADTLPISTRSVAHNSFVYLYAPLYPETRSHPLRESTTTNNTGSQQQQKKHVQHIQPRRSTPSTSLSLCVFMIVSPPSKNKKWFQTRGAGGESVLLCLSEPGGRHHVKHRGGPLYTPVKLY